MAFNHILTVFAMILTTKTAHSIPFVVFHGVNSKCGKHGVSRFTTLLSNWSLSQGYCIEIGDGAWDSWTMPLSKQTAIACEKVKKMSELSEGYNIIGLSQGNMVGRGVIEFCDGGPPVRSLISLAGPHAGIAAVPFVENGFAVQICFNYTYLLQSALLCILVDFLIELAVYSDYVQEHLAPASYIKIPTYMDGYKRGCRFLPKLNNELYRNSTCTERFASLENLVLIMFEQDHILVPKETSWFGYFPDGSWDPILPAQQTTLYTEDWIGLKKLDEAGRVKFVKIPGGHLEISYSDMKEHIVPYLVEDTTVQQRISELYHLQPEVIKLYA